MRIIGISPLDSNSTVTFMEDGVVIYACAEERLTRVKMQNGFPHLALQQGFEVTGWARDSIDSIAYAFFTADEEAALMQQSFKEDARIHGASSTSESISAMQRIWKQSASTEHTVQIPGMDSLADEYLPRKSWLKRIFYRLVGSSALADWMAHRREFRRWMQAAIADHQQWAQQLDEGLAQHGITAPVKRFRHHDTHAANAFFGSPYDSALAVTLDGYGSGSTGGIYRCDGQSVEPLCHFRFPNSLGIFYEQVTSGLGFRPSRHEGKIVGLAAYGDSAKLRDILLKRIDIVDGELRIRGGMNLFISRVLAGKFAKRDVAAAYQAVLEIVTRQLVEYWVAKTGCNSIVVSGGVHANVKLNQRIHEVDGVDNIFVYPNMSDGGCGTGAAMLAFAEAGIKVQPVDTVYHGTEYDQTAILDALAAENLAFNESTSIEQDIAQLLNQNRIVARFDGRMEYGPRSLGNRSILYPPGDPKVNQWLNHQLGRTEFMPFAPAVMRELGERLFLRTSGAEKTAEFMTTTFDCTEEMKSLCPAAVHIDGTARPQFVTETSNPGFYRILSQYYELSGVPALINTSFNMHEEPIVCTPKDAVRAFLLGNIDYLAIGDFLVPHPQLGIATYTDDQQAAA